ncbi:cell wall elongation regulator TseB-like domain-containing protein [Bacillus testis]|uniref:cell wall elongation regulator TseB-like domain-containing protein n=1 Tax=Bacillus testis TaxID=1622072 RepID=UPI00067F5FA1|nr:DUF5590 domain-containing protein [Bacillus testis]
MKKWIWIISLLIILIIGYVIASFMVGVKGHTKEEEKGIALAKEKGGLESVSEFYKFNGKKAYYVAIGKDSKGVKQVVWIPKKGDDPAILKRKYSEGVTRSEILEKANSLNPAKIISAKIGMIEFKGDKNREIWEVVFKDDKGKLNYYYYDFFTGEMLRNYENI